MNQIEEYMLDLEEIKAYRSLEGESFDFGTGLIENELSYGTEEAIWEMEQQDLEETIKWWNGNKEHTKRKRKYKLNHYFKKQIDSIKLKQLSKVSWFPVYYSDSKKRYIRCYLSGRRRYAKWCSNRAVRNRNDFSLKCAGYRKVYDYWWCVF